MTAQALLDDQIVKTQSMRASPFIKPLEVDALAWEELLLQTQVGVHDQRSARTFVLSAA
jgi:hypothetical protein